MKVFASYVATFLNGNKVFTNSIVELESLTELSVKELMGRLEEGRKHSKDIVGVSLISIMPLAPEKNEKPGMTPEETVADFIAKVLAGDKP